MRASIVSTLHSLVALLALVAGSSRPLRAQPPLGAVTLRISPDSGQLATGAFRSDTAVFRIHNDDAMEDIATLTCSVAGTITECSPPSQVVLAPGDSADVRIPFATGASGTGALALEAQGMAFGNRVEGSFAVTVTDTFAVSVTPLDSNPVGMEPSAYASIRFLVVNPSTTTVTYALSCTPSGPIGCVNLTASSLTLGRDGRDTVVATLVSQSATGAASAMLVAASDSAVGQGTYDVTVTREAVFSLVPSGGDRLVRGMCPVIGAGPESAAQCGDLLYAHALPAYRSMNRARAVTLMYGSALARPTPIVAVDYTTYPNDPRPDSVVVEVRRDGGLLAATWFSAAGFDLAQKQVHRLVVPIDAVAAGLGTGAHPVQVTLRRFANGAWLGSADTASTTLLVVDRRSSPFGAGWTLAGVERLHPNQLGNAVLLAFADGSALLFRPSANPADTSYVSPAGEHSRLVRLSAGGFVRTLAGGRVAIEYDSAGLVRSIRDNNPTPNVATYHWSPDPLDGARLDSIVDPALRAVRFDYDSAGRAIGIRVPGVAPVVLYQSTAPTGVARLDSLAGPDGFRLRYAYDGGSDLMTSSRSRGTGLVRYFYHATTATLDSVYSPGGAGLGRQLRAWQRHGAPAPGTGSRAVPSTPALADSARVVARWQRGTAWESVSFRVDRHYAPTEVTSPLGEVTRIDRDSIGQPVYVRTPSNGRIWQQWDARGNLVATIVRQFGGWQDPNVVRFDTTRYSYDSTWQELDTIVDPLGRRTEFGYDGYGRRTSVTDPTGRATTFEYSSRGQLVRITAPNADLTGPEAHPTEYAYDPATFNLRRTDRGVERIEYTYDSLNASDLVASRDASGQEVRYTYDAIKRPLAIDRGMGSVIRYEYDDTLRLVRQYDPVSPNPSVVERDAAGRVVRDCVRPNECDVVTYGDGVNPTHVLTRTGGAHMQQFDAAGRLLRREMSEGYAAEFDTVRFTYDAGGNATAVSNRFSNVYRTFDEYGRMRRERQEIRKWSEAWKDSLPDDAFMGVEAWHDYDRLGRRSRTWRGNTVTWTTVCQHTPLLPEQDPDDDPCRSKVALRATDSIAFAYDGAGRLASVTNTLWQRRKGTGNRVWRYAYDGRDRLTTFTVPTLTSSVEVHRGYDALDRLTSYAMPSHSVTLTRDDAGRVIDDGDFYTYDLLGRLTVVTSGNVSRANQFTYDLLGNRLTDKAFTYGYDGHGRLVSKSGNGCQGAVHLRHARQPPPEHRLRRRGRTGDGVRRRQPDDEAHEPADGEQPAGVEPPLLVRRPRAAHPHALRLARERRLGHLALLVAGRQRRGQDVELRQRQHPVRLEAAQAGAHG